jgi:protein O-mannosyl-transferase
VLHNGFVNFDDDIYIYANPHILHGLTTSGLRWALTSVDYVYYQPITWISHMVDVTWFGLDAAGHHAVSVLLHAATACMLMLLFFRATGNFWRSVCLTALFAFHPLRVESVAWAAERKDVLSGFFLILALLAYERYVRTPLISRYLQVVVVVIVGLLCKPMLVSAPFLLLLFDYWPLERKDKIAGLLKEKIPFFILAGVFAILAYLGQQHAGAMRTLAYVPALQRFQNAAISYVLYIGKTLWPVSLSALYPYPAQIPLIQTLAALLALGVIAIVAIRTSKNRRYLIVGWLWFVIGLLPVIGLVQVGMQAYADRFTYIPSIGLIAALVWGVADLTKQFAQGSKLLTPLSVILAGGLAVLTWIQIGFWHDSITLFQHTTAQTGPNPIAQQNLGEALVELNRNAEAIPHLVTAVQLSPQLYQAHYNLGKARASEGHIGPAIASFSRALNLNPASAEAYYGRGVMYERAGRSRDARNDIRESLKYGLSLPFQAEAHSNLGVLDAQVGDIIEAAAQFALAVQLQPDFADAQVNLSFALAQLGRRDEALARLKAALISTHGAASVQAALARLQRQ